MHHLIEAFISQDSLYMDLSKNAPELLDKRNHAQIYWSGAELPAPADLMADLIESHKSIVAKLQHGTNFNPSTSEGDLMAFHGLIRNHMSLMLNLKAW